MLARPPPAARSRHRMHETPDSAYDPLRARLQRSLGATLEIRRELQGGSGHVYLARDTALDRDVVVKAFWPDPRRQDDQSSDVGAPDPRRFAREIRITARLQHPN